MMIGLFSEPIQTETNRRSDRMRAQVKSIPCGSQVSEGFAASRYLKLFEIPHVEQEESSKTLKEDGRTALYIHRVTNAAALEYRPSSSIIIQGLGRAELYDDRLEIFVDASGNPEAKVRHAAVLKDVLDNVATLSREIEQANGRLSSDLARYVAERQKECEERARLQATL